MLTRREEPKSRRATPVALPVAFMFAAALLLAACGSEVDGVASESAEAGDAVTAEDEDAEASEDVENGAENAAEESAPRDTEEDTRDGEGTTANEEGADAEDGSTGSEEGTGEDAEAEGANESSQAGPSDHRASSDANEQCEEVETADPGAFFVFPDDDDPSTLHAGTSPATVEFLGCGNTFEANVQYEAYHGHDSTPTLEGFTMGGTLGNWGEFRFEETFWTPGEWRVIVFEIDAKHGDRRVYDEVTFTVDPS